MEVVFLLSAEQDLHKAYIWVEEHRHGREQIFLQDLELQLEHLKRFPLVGRIYRGRYRRLLISRYPLWYLLCCRVQQDCCSRYP
jgi:flavoprotein